MNEKDFSEKDSNSISRDDLIDVIVAYYPSTVDRGQFNRYALRDLIVIVDFLVLFNTELSRDVLASGMPSSCVEYQS